MTITQQIITIVAVVLGTVASPLPAIFDFPGRQKSAGCGPLPGNCASLCSYQPFSGLLSERCAGERYSRPSGGYCHHIYHFLTVKWKKNTLLSIAGGTILYMALVQMVFETIQF